MFRLCSTSNKKSHKNDIQHPPFYVLAAAMDYNVQAIDYWNPHQRKMEKKKHIYSQDYVGKKNKIERM